MSQIFGHDSVKQTITDVINSEKAINLILSDSPSTSKTFFLKLVQKSVEAQGAKTLFVDCATSSFSGLAAEVPVYRNLLNSKKILWSETKRQFKFLLEIF
jgi:hypothetical protein